MSTSSPPIEMLRATPTSGSGTLESPWTGWETGLERRAGGEAAAGVTVVFAPGFWGVSRAVRQRGDLKLVADAKEEGQPWLLPHGGDAGPALEALLVVDGVHRVTIQGLCFNGRRTRAASGVLVRCGTRIHLEGCRFGDFGDESGAAITIAGESEERFVREIVIQGCRIQHGARGLTLARNTSDLLVDENRFDDVSGPALLVDPQDTWTDYGLIFVKNRVTSSTAHRRSPHLRVLPGAEGLRLAENTIEMPAGAVSTEGTAVAAGTAGAAGANDAQDEAPAIEVRGGGPMSRRRLEVMLNRVVGSLGPGISARQCGPGFLAAGNHLLACGGPAAPALDLHACTGVLVEDNEISEIEGVGIRVKDCARARINGNEIVGSLEGASPRRGAVGLMLEGDGCRRVRVTDNRIRSVREEGIRVASGKSVRLTGNEVEDCGFGIRVANAQQFILVGNDCRDNSGGGIHVDPQVRRGFVALNYAILNGPVDLEVYGERVRCRSNKVDRRGTPEDWRPDAR